ncbi:hypothetical protein NHX12_023624 [Muraenolepis orangiensis]|uniref:Uncharacterized protein n=1 Tax=Muraenolepis orangiensis TaxID=630683 RepID=A0A9Q0EJU3_9TELE|nr:hypothetical protein NHX12_023624 [Muraenolepis orangiensis]
MVFQPVAGGPLGAPTPGYRAVMAGFVPGLLPTNHSQEKEFAQAYEDVLERYKGTVAAAIRKEERRVCVYDGSFVSFENKSRR